MTEQTNVELGFAWDVPAGWPEVTEQLPAEGEVVYRQAWANQANVAQFLSGSPPLLQETLMVLSVRVKSEADASFPPPGSQQETTPIGQQVAAQTLDGHDAAPFDLRLRYTIARAPYHYSLELGCLWPEAASDAARAAAEATCRDVWGRQSWDFGLCSLPAAPAAMTDAWQVVNDDYYGYAFEVPAAWQRAPHPTTDRAAFLFDQSVHTQPRACRLPNGQMAFSLDASPFGNFLPADGPDLTGYEPLPDRPAPTWIRHHDETEVGIEGATVDGLTVTSVYVRGDEYWYSLSFQCYAPSGSDDAAQAAFWAQCEAVFGHIFDSFQVRG